MRDPNYVFIESGHRPRIYKEIMRQADRIGLRHCLRSNPRTVDRVKMERTIYLHGEEQ